MGETNKYASRQCTSRLFIMLIILWGQHIKIPQLGCLHTKRCHHNVSETLCLHKKYQYQGSAKGISAPDRNFGLVVPWWVMSGSKVRMKHAAYSCRFVMSNVREWQAARMASVPEPGVWTANPSCLELLTGGWGALLTARAIACSSARGETIFV